MALDTSGFSIVQTRDGSHRFVCHRLRLLTTGFATRDGLLKCRDIIRDGAEPRRIMSERYTAEFGTGPDGAHFPGPWSLKKRRDGSYNVYSASHDVALCVAPCNAPLVRAAPDLLRALERLADCPDLNLDELEPETREAIAQARAALAMAADGIP